MEKTLPPIPVKRYFTIGEVSELCGVKPHVLRYWEQEFSQIRPIKRRGNRRYYQHHEVLMIRRIRDLLYDQGFTISGARNKMQELLQTERDKKRNGECMPEGVDALDTELDIERDIERDTEADALQDIDFQHHPHTEPAANMALLQLRRELGEIRDLLKQSD